MGDELDRPQRRRGGRPPAEDPRRPRAVRISDAEWAAISDRAARLGMRPHTLMREAALGRRLIAPVPAVNREAWAELAATTSNLNQITAHMNGGGKVSDSDLLSAVQAVGEQVRRLRLDLLGTAARPEGER